VPRAVPETPEHDAAALKSTGYVKRMVNALRYSLDGLRGAWQREAAFRTEVVAAIILVPLSFAARVTWLEHGLLIASVLLVMLAELVNSSIEAVVDRISTERHPLSKHAKDAGSAAVLVALLIAAAIWLSILLPVYWPR
jgi:diacylglycerol kinase (ATP)